MLLIRKLNQCIKTILLVLVVITTVQSCGPGRGIGGPRRSRKLTPLVFKQHVPNVSENTLGASGPQEGKITREDPRFKDLVPNYANDIIIFKDEEGTGADRLMTQRCKEKLNTLAVSVMNQWPGVRLRVTEGWDEEDFHASDSLHYEGRAVDITTSDRDRSKYGMLARLAVEAGFDWVYYESRAHIHCSVKSDSSQTSPHLTGCFSADSTVQTKHGHKRLDQLAIGEQVLSVEPSTGATVYSEVLMFLDRETNQTREFVQILTDGDHSITVTPSHLLLVWVSSKRTTQFMFADRVQEGDYLLVNVPGSTSASNNLEPRLVKHISVRKARGVYAPLTRAGTVIVDSIAASCYALVDSQKLAHWSFLPVRTVDTLLNWLRSTNLSLPQTSGIHWYARALYSIKDWILPIDWIYH